MEFELVSQDLNQVAHIGVLGEGAGAKMNIFHKPHIFVKYGLVT